MAEVGANDIKALGERLDGVNEKIAAVREGQGVTKWVSLIIALFTAAATGLSLLNAIVLQQVQEVQEKLDEKQKELSQGMSVLHESLTLLDTKEPELLQQKIQLQIQLLSTILGDADGPVSNPQMRIYYASLLLSLAQLLTNNDTKETLIQFLKDAAFTSTLAVPQLTQPATLPTNPPSRPPIVDGEATAPARTKGLALDVFWCVRGTKYGKTNKNEELAQSVFNALVDRQLDENLGQIRLRRLPEIINQTPLYSIDRGGVIIRFNDDRRQDAIKVQEWVSTALKNVGSDSPAILEQAHSKLQPHYLPVYVCSEE